MMLIKDRCGRTVGLERSTGKLGAQMSRIKCQKADKDRKWKSKT